MEVCAKAQALSWRNCAPVGRASCLDGRSGDAPSPHCRQMTPICNFLAKGLLLLTAGGGRAGQQHGCGAAHRRAGRRDGARHDARRGLRLPGVRLRTAHHTLLASTDIAKVCILSHTLYSRAATAPGMTLDLSPASWCASPAAPQLVCKKINPPKSTSITLCQEPHPHAPRCPTRCPPFWRAAQQLSLWQCDVHKCRCSRKAAPPDAVVVKGGCRQAHRVTFVYLPTLQVAESEAKLVQRLVARKTENMVCPSPTTTAHPGIPSV